MTNRSEPTDAAVELFRECKIHDFQQLAYHFDLSSAEVGALTGAQVAGLAARCGAERLADLTAGLERQAERVARVAALLSAVTIEAAR